MKGYTHSLTLAHQRYARKKGNGNASEGVRILIEESMKGFVERRKGAADRRKKGKK